MEGLVLHFCIRPVSRALVLLAIMDIRAQGAISARHIREMASNAAKDGFVWDPPLFALLDDIIARLGWF